MRITVLAVLLCACSVLFSQNHVSVHLDSQIYHILEQAETRGLCSPLPGSKPYTQNIIVKTIKEILYSDNAGKLRSAERIILEQYLDKYAKPDAGINWQKGAWYAEAPVGNSDIFLSANAGVSADIEGSAGLYPASAEHHFGTEVWAHAYLKGDIGNYVSYGFIGEGGLMKVPRTILGKGNTYYESFESHGEYQNQDLTVVSEPLAHFPYSYKKRWDGSVFFLNKLSSLEYWPEEIAGGYGLQAELTASFFDDRLMMRMGRMSHEWGSTPLCRSLAFNKMARPFFGIEAGFNPFSWFSIASLTGALEYYNTKGEKESSKTFQNFYSLTMLQFRYKNYLFFDFIDAVVWPKRFELGYMAPIISNFFYQNNIGDFDNMAITLNLKAQYPGLGNIWFSLFIDEVDINTRLFELDRSMLAMQAGAIVSLPFLAFSSITLSYTKVNPYCYGHNRNFNPWYGNLIMETAYINNGVSLGHYIPPNSDELLIGFKTMPAKNLAAHLQYQMIRHGASYGSGEVDGSSLLSELDPSGRSTNAILTRYFLQDGAYQWMHIIRMGAEWNLPRLPVVLFGEAGTIISYFTNIAEQANITGEPHPYSIIDTPEYPKSTGFVVTLGVRIFPR